MFSELNTESFTNITADGGIKKKMITQGTGDLIKENQEVGVKYCGNLKDQIFDQTYKEPFRYTIGNHEVPICWEIAAMTMKLGEKAEFIIEPKYGYLSLPGEKSKLPNFTISLEIEIVEINPPSKKLCDMNIFEKIDKAKKFKQEGVQKFGEKDIEWALEKFERAIYFIEGINEKDDMKDNKDFKNNECHHGKKNNDNNDNEIQNKFQEMNIGNSDNVNLENKEDKKEENKEDNKEDKQEENNKIEIENKENKKEENNKIEIENKENKKEGNNNIEIVNKENKKEEKKEENNKKEIDIQENNKIEIDNKEDKKEENKNEEIDNKEEKKEENKTDENNNINIESKNNKMEEIKQENNENNENTFEITTNKKTEEEAYKEANELLISLYTNLANCENHLKNYPKILFYTTLGLKLRKTPKLLYFKTIAELYSHNLDLAIETFNELLKLVKEEDKGIIYLKELIEKKQKEREEREKKFMRSIPRQIIYEYKEIKKSISPPLEN